MRSAAGYGGPGALCLARDASSGCRKRHGTSWLGAAGASLPPTSSRWWGDGLREMRLHRCHERSPLATLAEALRRGDALGQRLSAQAPLCGSPAVPAGHVARRSGRGQRRAARCAPRPIPGGMANLFGRDPGGRDPQAGGRKLCQTGVGSGSRAAQSRPAPLWWRACWALQLLRPVVLAAAGPAWPRRRTLGWGGGGGSGV